MSGGRPGNPKLRDKSVDPVRAVARDVVRAVRERDAYANLLLPSMLRERGLSGRDAALATELTYGTLRAQGTLDKVIASAAGRPVTEIDGKLLDVLRLGAYQLLRTRIGSHAAVSTSVDLVRSEDGQGPAGFVNAVLRKISQRDEEMWADQLAPSIAQDPVGHLAFAYAHPRWIAEVFADALGGSIGSLQAALAAVLAVSGCTERVDGQAVSVFADPFKVAGMPATDGPTGLRENPNPPTRTVEGTDHGQIVRHEQIGDAALALDVGEQIEDLAAHRDVEGGDRLVEHDQRGIAGDGARDGDALALAARELARLAAEQMADLQHLGHACDRLFALFLRDLADLHAEGDVLRGGHVFKQSVVLKHHADTLPQAVQLF